MTNENLMKQSCELIKVFNQTDVIYRLLENMQYQIKQGDNLPLKHFIVNGGLDSLLDNLADIKDDILEISNDLCPNEQGR
ncbi:hypothetical protein P7E05_13335 [Enterococcus gallinarum]|uniref:hypothetical protein n=1 Tax=Enterococcus gallinarum TaxID=1353 RepID=UPI00288E67A9|nr:hypothetical protein [Enterococcus gallinarum]MDT2709558.1 hypothetical protein [Enterococcus gallinarum]MDT2718521.1 hypothetical protein [Enterococcus gallinarum]